jgi:hypothetical protein
MATVYKWYPGHYLLEAGNASNANRNTIDNGLIDKIAGTGTNLIPNIRGIQKRFTWRQLEPTRGAYNFTPILNDLQKFKDETGSTPYPRYLRILLMYKGIGGKGAPNYLSVTTDPGYDSAFGPGIYNWNGTSNEHPCFWLPAVEERFALFLDAMGAALDSIGRPAGDPRYFLSTVDFNETSWGPTPTDDQKNKMGEALKRLQLRLKAAFPTTICGHFLNFPNTASYSVLKVLAPHMRDNGLTLGGPDTWWNDTSVEGPPLGNGVYGYYDDASGLTAISPSVQNQNFNHDSHANATSDPPIYNDQIIDGPNGLQPLYDRVTTAGTTIAGTFRPGLRGTHITWQAAPWRIYRPTDGATATGPIIWDTIRNFFLNKWLTGPDAGNITPGINATSIPVRLDNNSPTTPATPTLALTTDTGPITADLITANAAVTVTGATVGAVIEYATALTGPWNTAVPAPVQGSNTWYARQVVSGVPSAASAPLTFQFDNTIPVLLRATVTGNVLLLTYDDAQNLTNAAGFKAVAANFSVKNGSTTVPVSGTFVSEPLKRQRLDLGVTLVGGETITVSYTQPTSGTARLQDMAGNYAANLVNEPVINTTGMSAPTTTATITTAGGVADGGYSNAAAPVLVGTLSAPLAGQEELEIQRSSAGGGFATIGYATAVTGTSWSYTDTTLAEAVHVYRARVRLGDLLGAFSASVTVTLDRTPSPAPSAASVTVSYGTAPRLVGTWSAGDGDTLSVSVGPQSYTTANGLVTVGTAWTLDLPPQLPGRYDISARTTDRAGNVSLSEEDADLVVLPQPSINHARLAKARRRP